MNLPNFSQLSHNQDLYFMASGGRDSTAMVLEAHAHGIGGTLVFGDTGFNLSSARQTINKLAELTGYPLVHVRYDGSMRPIDILKESFSVIPDAIKLKNQRKTYKKLFLCCDILKKKPMNKFVRSLDRQSAVSLVGIKGGDRALHRYYWMRDLRQRGTFYRRRKSNGLLYYYPLRDCQNNDIASVLREYGFQDVKPSGCSICPIFCVGGWKKRNPKRWRRSARYAKQLGIEFPMSSDIILKECTNKGE